MQMNFDGEMVSDDNVTIRHTNVGKRQLVPDPERAIQNNPWFLHERV